MLEIGTGESVSLISNLGQETHPPVSLISNVRNWPFFCLAACGVHKGCERANEPVLVCIK